jgi:hypothetical protein
MKTCKACGLELKRKRFNGRLEDLTVFKKRIYCDRACMAKGFVKDVPSDEGTYHLRAKKLRGSFYEACGATKKLHAHHIDSNPKNNCQENIQTLCASCHAIHHHRARRAGLTVAGRAESLGLSQKTPEGWTTTAD